jgi:hypothetical protein
MLSVNTPSVAHSIRSGEPRSELIGEASHGIAIQWWASTGAQWGTGKPVHTAHEALHVCELPYYHHTTPLIQSLFWQLLFLLL